MEVAIMIEGQNSLNWPRWQRMAQAVDQLGFAGLYRSDHITNPGPPEMDSLDLWPSLTWLASNTSRIEFGPLVSPVSMRHPVMTARQAAAVDDLSGGRLVLGIGAGWIEREHTNYGFDLLDLDARFARFREGLEVVTRLLQNDAPGSFSGSFFRLQDAILLPRPQRPGGPPILVGGNGALRTLPLAARYANEWNSVFSGPDKFRELSQRLDGLLQAESRDPRSVRRSLMTGCFYAHDEAKLREKLGGRPIEQMRERTIVGGPDEAVQQLGRYAAAGVQRIMLQWLDLDDIEGVEHLAQTVLPQVRTV